MVYLIIKTGYEGIEDICYCSHFKFRAKKYLKKAQANEVENEAAQHIELALDNQFPDNRYATELNNHILRIRKEQKIRDFFCVQKWSGKAFECVCQELDVSPSKLMLR